VLSHGKGPMGERGNGIFFDRPAEALRRDFGGFCQEQRAEGHT